MDVDSFYSAGKGVSSGRTPSDELAVPSARLMQRVVVRWTHSCLVDLRIIVQLREVREASEAVHSLRGAACRHSRQCQVRLQRMLGPTG